MPKTWRDECRPIIAEVLRTTKGESEANIRWALRAAFPFGPRTHHPYKIWLSEVRKQRGVKDVDKGPMELFEGAS
jgi:hypothetical protein